MKTWKFSIIPVGVSKSHLGLNFNLRSMGQARYNLVYPKGSQPWPSTSPSTNLLSYFTKSFLRTWRCFRVNLSSRSVPREGSSCSLYLTNCKKWNEDDLKCPTLLSAEGSFQLAMEASCQGSLLSVMQPSRLSMAEWGRVTPRQVHCPSFSPQDCATRLKDWWSL